MVVGIGGVIYFTVKACQKTYEAHDIIDEHEAEMEDIKEEAEKGMPQDVRKERIRTLYVKTGKKLFKLYYKVVAGEVVAIACICCGFGLLKKRYLDVVAAYAGLTAKFKDYRKRVTEDVGEAVEAKYLDGLKTVEEKTESGEITKKFDVDEHVRIRHGLQGNIIGLIRHGNEFGFGLNREALLQQLALLAHEGHLKALIQARDDIEEIARRANVGIKPAAE